MVKVSKKNEPAKFELQIVDPGVEDKRCFAVLGELGELIVMMLREGNTLSAKLRESWDCREFMDVNTRKEPIHATRAHISVFAGITAEELLKLIPKLPLFDGLANRFWGPDRTLQSLRFGGRVRLCPIFPASWRSCAPAHRRPARLRTFAVRKTRKPFGLASTRSWHR